MATDLFASIRKRDTGVSTSFSIHAATPQHDEATSETPCDPRKTAVKHLQPPKHRDDAGGRRNSSAVGQTRTVAEIRRCDIDWLPRVWRDGLDRLNTMLSPRSATPTRWRELIMDAHRLAWGWHDLAEARGWSLETLFGFDANDPFEDKSGLVFRLRGARVLGLIVDDRGRSVAAAGDDATGGYRWIYQRPVANAHLIWGRHASELLD